MTFLLPSTTFASSTDAINQDQKAHNVDCVANIDTALSQNPSRKIDKVLIQSNPIFDESDPDTIALHRFANRFHITTKSWVIEERLTFAKGDELDEQDLKEAEAILRDQRYLRDARVRFMPNCSPDEPVEVLVETWDDWSLVPTLSFSRSGGENKSTIGVKQDNLLGMGIRTRFRYNQDEQRSGYELSLGSAVPWTKHANVFINLLDNDDGTQIQFIYDQPFYHLGTQRMRFAEFMQDQRVDDIFQNGNTRNSFNIDHHRYQLALGWQVFNANNISGRLSIGVSDEQALFSIDEFSPSNDPLFLPADRQYQYPWIAYEHLQRDIVVMENIYLIGQAEDINLGWQFRTQLGFELNDVGRQHDFGYHILMHAKKGTLLGDGLLLFSLNTRADLNTQSPEHLRLDVNSEYFYPVSDALRLYGRLSSTFSSNPFLDDPIVLDDDTGVRGYPRQYQHGNHRVSASIEARLYTGYNFYKLFDLGFASFVDAGRAFNGASEAFNESNDTLASIGIGARLFSTRSSTGGVVHIDFTTPLSDGENIDSWEWRLQMRSAF
jgi:outer membrane protein assembly factor BamA